MFNRIRNLREDHDFNQFEIADKLGVSQSQYQRYESGKRQIPIDILIQLAQIYNVSVDYLLGLSNSKKLSTIDVNTDTKKVLFYFNRLNTENRKYILEKMAKLYQEQFTKYSSL